MFERKQKQKDACAFIDMEAEHGSDASEDENDQEGENEYDMADTFINNNSRLGGLSETKRAAQLAQKKNEAFDAEVQVI